VFAIGDMHMDQDPPKKPNMERDIRRSFHICDKIEQNPEYAQKMYAALCNTQWGKQDVFERLKGTTWSCSWRYAGELVANISNRNESYIDYYCSGGESHIDDEIREDLRSIGWICLEDYRLE
jgi:hypothetical protein